MFAVCKNLFDYLNENNIRYCHWKSNSHLDKALEGKTDLDLLVHQDDKDFFLKALKLFDIKKIVSHKEKYFDGLEDYLGFDQLSGKLIHLHVHYRLVLGQRHIKNHHIPLEEVFFNNLITKYNVYTPCPELELLFLIIRAHMKVDLISLLKHGLKGFYRQEYTAFPADIEKEIHELIGQSNPEKFKRILLQCNLGVEDKVFTEFLDKYSTGRLKFYDVLSRQYDIFSGLKKFKRETGGSVYFKYVYLILKNSKFFSSFVAPGKKTIVGQGKIISLVGADGAGKSTHIADIEKWLSWKLDVVRYYYGIPKTFQVKVLSLFIRGFSKFRLYGPADIVENSLWLYVARKRVAVFTSSQSDRQKGKVVITDRFPMREFFSMSEPMDGPRIQKVVKHPLPSFSKSEVECYKKILPPDRILVLQVEPEELRRRKSDLDFDLQRTKASAVNSLREEGPVVLIDANQPYSQVQLTIKRLIWDLL